MKLGISFFQVQFFEEGWGLVLFSEMYQREQVFSRTDLCNVVIGRYTAFSNNKKMVTILHRELEHKVEKVQHMKLEVMRPKTKNNMNFQPE